MQLEEIQRRLNLTGVEPDQVVRVIATISVGEGAVEFVYSLPDGTMREHLLHERDAEQLALATVERPWAFDGDGAAFQLACEARQRRSGAASGASSRARTAWRRA